MLRISLQHFAQFATGRIRRGGHDSKEPYPIGVIRGEVMFNVVLVEPEIPPNTGNIGRLCLATRSTLHLVKPLGFSLDNRELCRAGLDYWEEVPLKLWDSFDA